MHDLEDIEREHPGWTEDMIMIGNAKSDVMAKEMDRARQKSSTPQPPIAKGLGGQGKQVIRRSLLSDG